MSYRTTINGVQIFGNNEYYPEWISFIKSQGITIGEDGQYDGRIADFMAAMDVCERIVLRLDAERIADLERLRKEHRNSDPQSKEWIERRYASLFDLTGIRRKISEEPRSAQRPFLFDELYDLVDSGYLFLPMALYEACKKDLVPDFAHPERFRAYKLKKGRTIRVHAG